MPYQPPHLRNGGTSTAPPADSRNGGSFGGYGRRSEGSRDSGSRDYGSSFGSRDVARSDSGKRTEAAPTSNGVSSKASAGPQAVFPDWQPSERALNMNEEQIKEARERLNISVEGEASPSVPLEAFDDMVRQHSMCMLLLWTASCIVLMLRVRWSDHLRLIILL